MGVYNSVIIDWSDAEQRANRLNDFLNSLNGISADISNSVVTWQGDDYDFEGVHFIFDNTSVEGFVGWVSNKGVWWLKNNSEYISGPTVQSNNNSPGSIRSQYYIDDKCIVFSLTDSVKERFQVALVDVGTTLLVGYADIDSATFVDISTMVFKDIADPIQNAHAYTNMFPYGAPPGTLDFLAQAYFVNGNGVKAFKSDLLKECSTVTLLSTVSLPSPLGNHLAIGAHCIAPLDEEEGGDE